MVDVRDDREIADVLHGGHLGLGSGPFKTKGHREVPLLLAFCAGTA
jgi:hypothetical protein